MINMINRKFKRKSTITTIYARDVQPLDVYGFVKESAKQERKKKTIFGKLTKQKRRDEKCESNPNKKSILILTFALCFIVMVAGGSVKMK